MMWEMLAKTRSTAVCLVAMDPMIMFDPQTSLGFRAHWC